MEQGYERVLKLKDSDIIELHAEGLMDIEIAEIMGVSITTANVRRRRLGLPKNKQHSRTAKRWKVYDSETDEYLTEGTAREIAEQLHIAESSVYYYARMSKHEVPCRYKAYEVAL